MNIVVSRFNKNIDWIYKIKDENILVYDKQNDQNIYNIPVNKGNEASVYLKYIIDFYFYYIDLNHCTCKASRTDGPARSAGARSVRVRVTREIERGRVR